MNLFERYLSLWVALCIVAGVASRTSVTRTVRDHCERRGRAGQPAGRRAGLADDHPDAAEDRLRRARPGARALARRRRHAVHQLGGEAVLDGVAGLDIHRAPVRAMAAVRANPFLYRRPHSAGGGALHGDGVRVVEPVRRRAALHPEPGRAQRRHHDVCLCAAGRPAAGRCLHHRALGDPADIGGAVYRGARHRRAAMATRAARHRAGSVAADTACAAAGVTGRVADHAGACCSGFRANRSSHSRS